MIHDPNASNDKNLNIIHLFISFFGFWLSCKLHQSFNNKKYAKITPNCRVKLSIYLFSF
jgi:hypothetical protein